MLLVVRRGGPRRSRRGRRLRWLHRRSRCCSASTTFSSVSEALDGVRVRARGSETRGSCRCGLSPFVHVVLAPNPGVMTGPGTNTYVFGSGPTFVIDPAVDDEDYLDAVLDVAGEVSAILITHRHSDHVGGARGVDASGPARRCARSASRPRAMPTWSRSSDGERLVGGTRSELVALHTPGHASDHLCFYLEGRASLFAGDNVLGEGTAVIAPPDGNMADYMQQSRVDAVTRRRSHLSRAFPSAPRRRRRSSTDTSLIGSRGKRGSWLR